MGRDLRSETRMTYPKLRRWCGAGAAAAGALFLAWGYLDGPELAARVRIVVEVLSFAVPALFMVGVLGLYVRCKGFVGLTGGVGLVLASLGSALGVLVSLTEPISWRENAILLAFSSGWLPALLGGMTLAGVATAGRRGFGVLRALPLVLAASGWAYYFTESGFYFEARPAHVGFGLLFGLSWGALGFALLVREGGGLEDETRGPGL